MVFNQPVHMPYSRILLAFFPTLRYYFFCCILVATWGCGGAEPEAEAAPEVAPVVIPDTTSYPSGLVRALHTPSAWVDSVFKTLSVDERIAQLMIVEAFSNRGAEYEEDLLMLVQRYKIGGVIFFQGGPVRQASLTNRLQAASKVPLLVSMDAESGVGMRLDSTVNYPLQMLLGAVAEDSLVYQMGAEVAAEFRRLGMHLNFSPVADINNNPANPVISYRAFGENREKVTEKSIAFMQGMQDHGIIATAKHFPGHGDTDVDSHYDLPIIPHDRRRLDSLELHPFRALIRAGIGGIMVAHMDIPELDSVVNLPSTLSRPIVTGLLQQELNYRGLVITDAMVMKGVTKFFRPGEAEVKALAAGNDILERLVSVPRAIERIKAAIARGELTQAEIDRRCKKVLAAKQWVGLDRYQPIALENLVADLNSPQAEETRRHLAEASVTLLRNRRQVVPLYQGRRQRIATVSFGAAAHTPFQQELDRLYRADHFVMPRRSAKKAVDALRIQLRSYDKVIVSIHGPSVRPSNNLGFLPDETLLIRDLARSGKAIVCLFDNAYALPQFGDLEVAAGLLVSYQQIIPTQVATARVIAGELEARGRLPVTVNRHFTYGMGLE